MSNDIFLDNDEEFRRRRPVRRSNKSRSWVVTVAMSSVLLIAAAWFVYAQFRIDVPTGEMAILTAKSGKDIANANEVAPGPEYRGVQREFLLEGRYFKNPYYWEWEVIKQEVVDSGKIGVLISLTGDDLGYGEFLAKVDEAGNPTTKGIMPDALRPGRYAIHPGLFALEMHDPVTVPAGYRGVLTNLAGPLVDDPNVLLVPAGSRGVQDDALDEGTYYINPYVTQISLVDCRSQRFNLAQKKDMGFPSKDGFWVSLDGIIEFRVKPEKAAEVYVTYNEEENGDAIDEEIIRKVILPNARSFCRLEGSNKLGKDFMETRGDFEQKFEDKMQEACDKLGIEIIQALITRLEPPQKIAEPVRARQIAVETEKQYKQEMLQQESEQKLAVEQELIKQKQALVQAEQRIVKVTTEAQQEQDVAVTKANQEKAVADVKLLAAKDEAAAVTSRGRAEAEVVRLQNEADAAGWKASVEAFSGEGGQFSRYVLYQKMAPAYRKLMINTADSPIMSIFEGFEEAAPGGKSPSKPTPIRPKAETAKASVED